MIEGLCKSGILRSVGAPRSRDFRGLVEVARLPIFANCRTMKFFRWCETLIEMDMLFFLDIFRILT